MPTKSLTDFLSLKSEVYSVNAAVSKGEIAPTLFSSTDRTWHKNVRRAMNPFFNQTTGMTYEPFVERTIEVFTTELNNRFVKNKGRDGIIEFPTWLSYFKFDIISDLSYSKRHGLLSHVEDMYGIHGWVAFGNMASLLVDSMSFHDCIHRALKLIPTGGPNALG